MANPRLSLSSTGGITKTAKIPEVQAEEGGGEGATEACFGIFRFFLSQDDDAEEEEGDLPGLFPFSFFLLPEDDAEEEEDEDEDEEEEEK
jgi:hypothetical protein